MIGTADDVGMVWLQRRPYAPRPPVATSEPQQHRAPLNKYRDRLCKTIEMTGVYPTILKFPELGDL